MSAVASGESDKAGGKENISVAAEPDWLVRTKVRDFGRRNGAPVTTLLSERRVHVPLRSVYTRNVNRLESSQAVQKLSRVEIPFDPLTQSLVIHGISIFRSGVLTNHADLGRIEVIRREQQLEAGIVNGQLSALLLLKDVRIGDVLDVAFSVRDEGGLFAEEMSWIQSAAETYPMGSWIFSWIDQADRALKISEPGGTVTLAEEKDGTLLIRTWSAREVPAIEPEPDLPADVFQYPILQITPFVDWGGIVAKLLSKWDFTAADRAPLDEELAAIRQSAGDDRDRLIDAAVAAARDAVRYQNYSPGMLAIVPENVSIVWERRFGDCKEKSLLLTWLLRECGIEAVPALVSSGIGAALPLLLPAPTLFDHVVTMIRTEDGPLWIDPTDTYRGGRPSSWKTLPFSWALPLEKGAAGLVKIPKDGEGETFIKVREKVTARRMGRDADYEIGFTFGGRRADFIRRLVDSQGMNGAVRTLRDFIGSTRQGIELSEDAGYEDERDGNIVKFHITGSRPEAVRPHPQRGPDQLVISPFTFVRLLPGIDRVKRKYPLAVGSRDHTEHLVEVVHPDVMNADYPLQSVANPAFKVKAGSYMEAGNPVFKFSCVILQDRVAVEDLPQYKADIEKAYGIADVVINLPRQKEVKTAANDPEAKWGATESSGGNGIKADYRMKAAGPVPMKRRRTHQPVYTGRPASNPMTAMRFGGIGVMLIIIILKAILMMMSRN